MTDRSIIHRLRSGLAATLALGGALVAAPAVAAIDPAPVPALPPPLGDGSTTTSTITAPPRHRVYFTRSTGDRPVDIWSVDPTSITGTDVDGDAAPVTAANSAARDYSPEVSRDGRWLSFVSDRDGDAEVYVLDLAAAGSTPVQLTRNSTPDLRPVWSPDGAQLAFVGWATVGSARGKILPRAQIVPRAGGQARVLDDTSSSVHFTPAWSPDGSTLAVAAGTDTDADLFLYDVRSLSLLRRLTDGPARQVNWQPDWAPDGARIAFTRRTFTGSRDESDVLVLRADGSALQSIVVGPDTDAEQADWHPDGASLVFSGLTRTERRIHRVDVPASGPAGAPRQVLATPGAFDTQPDWAAALGD